MADKSEFIEKAEDRTAYIMSQVYENNLVLCKKKGITLQQQFEGMNAHGLTYQLSSFKRWNRESASYGNYKNVGLVVISAIAQFHNVREEILMFHELNEE